MSGSSFPCVAVVFFFVSTDTDISQKYQCFQSVKDSYPLEKTHMGGAVIKPKLLQIHDCSFQQLITQVDPNTKVNMA